MTSDTSKKLVPLVRFTTSKAITKKGGKKLMQSGSYTKAVDVLKVLNSDEAFIAHIKYFARRAVYVQKTKRS